MLRAIPKGIFSWGFDVHEEGRAIAAVDVSWMRERGELLVKGESCSMYREGLLGDFVLEWKGGVVARATKPSAFHRRFVVRYEGRELELGAKSVFGRTFVLLDGGAEIGRIAPEGIFTRKARIDLPDDVPLPVQVFMFWLVVILWRRSARSNNA